MYSFLELKKAAKDKIEGKENRLAILGNCTTQFFSLAVQGYAKKKNFNLNVLDTDYNQIDIQLLDSNSEVYSFKPDEILIWISTDKIYEEFLDLEIQDRENFAEFYLQKLQYYWALIEKNGNFRILQMNFTEINDKAFGNYSCKIEISFIFQLRKLNYLLQVAMSEQKNVYPIDILSVQMQLGQNLYYDASLYYNAKVTVALNALPYVAKSVVDVLLAMNGKIKKCVILDLDNTLWGGVIGDDGLENIEIGEFGKGHAFADLQRWLKQLRERGIILAVCSKNNEDMARAPFEKHEEMILKLSDISIFVANWNDKASNISYIQKSLNIGMDSIVFLDDNPFERNLVKSIFPEIEVPELPEDSAQYLSFLQGCNYFDIVSYSGEDAERTKQYQVEFARRQLQQEFGSIDDYLIGLEMIGKVRAFEPAYYSRIAQLTQRSNQFNLRTIRYTEDEIQLISKDDQYITLYYMLEDKFGNYGVVAVVILEKRTETDLFVNTWLMSCRVLKRGMEEFIVNCIVREAIKQGFKNIFAEYIPTAKNSMVSNIYTSMGFMEIDENKYWLEIKRYQIKKTFIREKV